METRESPLGRSVVSSCANIATSGRRPDGALPAPRPLAVLRHPTCDTAKMRF
jgi:hypothetical protein